MGNCMALFSPIAEVPQSIAAFETSRRGRSEYDYDSLVNSLTLSVEEGKKLFHVFEQNNLVIPDKIVRHLVERSKDLQSFDVQWESRQNLESRWRTNQMGLALGYAEGSLTKKEASVLRKAEQTGDKLEALERRKDDLEPRINEAHDNISYQLENRRSDRNEATDSPEDLLETLQKLYAPVDLHKSKATPQRSKNHKEFAILDDNDDVDLHSSTRNKRAVMFMER